MGRSLPGRMLCAGRNFSTGLVLKHGSDEAAIVCPLGRATLVVSAVCYMQLICCISVLLSATCYLSPYFLRYIFKKLTQVFNWTQGPLTRRDYMHGTIHTVKDKWLEKS